MFDFMIRNLRLIRVEVIDVVNVIYDGIDVIMLFGEIVVGKYFVEVVKMMVIIVKRIEEILDYDRLLKENGINNVIVIDVISYVICIIVVDLNVLVIIIFIFLGYIVRMVFKFRLKFLIIVIINNEKIMNKLVFIWGVYLVKFFVVGNIDEVIEKVIEVVR